jgi:hypothetical protein
MKERWDWFTENFEGMTEKVDGTIISESFSVGKKNLEMYYIMVDEEGFRGLDEGVYVVINKTFEEWNLDQNLQNIVEDIILDDFFERKALPDGLIDLEKMIIVTPTSHVEHEGEEKDWLILQLQTFGPANFVSFLGRASSEMLCLN